MPADYRAATIDYPDQPFSRGLPDLYRDGQRQPALQRSGNNRLGDRVFGCLVESCRKPQQLIRLNIIMGVDRNNPRSAIGQRSGLVENERTRVPSPRAARPP